MLVGIVLECVGHNVDLLIADLEHGDDLLLGNGGAVADVVGVDIQEGVVQGQRIALGDGVVLLAVPLQTAGVAANHVQGCIGLDNDTVLIDFGISVITLGSDEAAGVDMVMALQDKIDVQFSEDGSPVLSCSGNIAVSDVGSAGVQGLVEADSSPLTVGLGVCHSRTQVCFLLGTGVCIGTGSLQVQNDELQGAVIEAVNDVASLSGSVDVLIHLVVVVVTLGNGNQAVGEHVLAAGGVRALVVKQPLPLCLVVVPVGDVTGQVNEVGVHLIDGCQSCTQSLSIGCVGNLGIGQISEGEFSLIVLCQSGLEGAGVGIEAVAHSVGVLGIGFQTGHDDLVDVLAAQTLIGSALKVHGLAALCLANRNDGGGVSDGGVGHIDLGGCVGANMDVQLLGCFRLVHNVVNFDSGFLDDFSFCGKGRNSGGQQQHKDQRQRSHSSHNRVGHQLIQKHFRSPFYVSCGVCSYYISMHLPILPQSPKGQRSASAHQYQIHPWRVPGSPKSVV